MSDSMREQLLKAGFKETAKQKKSKPARKKANSKTTAKTGNSAADPETVAKRKRIKAEIKTAIEADKIEKTSGDIAHSYLVGKRIKQLFVNEDTRTKLIGGEYVITRLNGSTYIIPAQTGTQIKTLNPDWVVIHPNESSSENDSDDYADYQVPDDLQW